MKRIVSLCCVALIFVFSLAAPVVAAEVTDTSNFIQLLDYDSVNADGNFFYFDGSTSVSLSMPYQTMAYYCDILFTSTAGGLSVNYSWSTESGSLTVVSVGNNIYRAYGTLLARNYTDFNLTFSGSSSNTYFVNLLSCRVACIPVDHFVTDSYCHIVSPLYTNLIHYVSTDAINYRYVDASESAPYDCAFTLNLYANDWEKYDYLDFALLVQAESISSVTASCGDKLLDFEVGVISNSDLIMKDYRVYARLDLRELDRTSSDIPMITITGQWSPGWINMVQVLSTSGYISVGNTNPIFYFFRDLISITSNGFANLDYKIQLLFDSWFTNLYNWMETHTNSIVAAIRGDTTSGNEFQNEVQQELDELDQAQAVMDSVTKPPIEDIDVSVDQYVSQADIEVLAAPMAVFFQGELFSSIIIMSILLATVSYVLYGKR